MDIQYSQCIYDVSMTKTSRNLGDLEVVQEAAPKRSLSARIEAFFRCVFLGFIKSRQESADRYIAMHKNGYKW